MILIPKALYVEYLELLKNSNVPAGYHAEYVKWLRYFLDFCAKYVITIDKPERLRLFLGKLREKKQGVDQCNRAAHAVSLYYVLRRQNEIAQSPKSEPDIHLSEIMESACPPQSSKPQRKSQFVEAGYQEKSDSQEWDAVLAAMAAEIKVRHYSRKTLKTYGKWARCFQRFLKNKSPVEVATEDVKEYLTFLAVS